MTVDQGTVGLGEDRNAKAKVGDGARHARHNAITPSPRIAIISLEAIERPMLKRHRVSRGWGGCLASGHISPRIGANHAAPGTLSRCRGADKRKASKWTLPASL